MPKTPGKIHMYDIVNIDTIVFEIVGGTFKAPPRSDRVKPTSQDNCPNATRKVTKAGPDDYL